MHEMSLCEAVPQVIEEHAERHGFSRVKTVWLEIGVPSGVELEAMRFSFDAAKKTNLGGSCHAGDHRGTGRGLDQALCEHLGSEYWSYLLPRYAGKDNAERIIRARLPMGTREDLSLGLIDDSSGRDAQDFVAGVKQRAADRGSVSAFEPRLE